MIKSRTIIEVEVKGRDYRFECCPDSPLEDVQQALAVMQEYVQGRLLAAKPPEAPEQEA